MIVQTNPELVTLSDIELARSTSLASISSLNSALGIQKLRQEDIPLEIMAHIERFVIENG